MKLKRKLEKILVERAIRQRGRQVKEQLDLKNIKSEGYNLADFIEVPSTDIFTKAEALSYFVKDFYDKGYYTYSRILLGPAKNRVKIFDRYTQKVKDMIMMGSNNFLGLSYHPDVIRVGREALLKYGGGTGSYLLNGCFDIHRKLEEKLAEMKGTEAAILFPTGYAANVGTLSSLIRTHDVAISDRLNHASIVDGCRLAGGGTEIYRHRDTKHLEEVLKSCQGKYEGKLIVTDGVFSMDGDIAPLSKIYNLARTYNARIMVDDAFGTGILGKNGHGTIEHYGLKKKIDIVMATFTKSLGNIGAAICSSKRIVSYLRLFARSIFFSASPTPANCTMVYKAIEIMEKDTGLRERLWKNREYFVKNLVSMGFNLAHSETPILPLIVGDEQKLRDMSKMIHEAGLLISPIPYPAVPKEAVRFRICIMATHTKEDLDEALTILRKAGKKYHLI